MSKESENIINIPNELYSKLEKQREGTDFKSVSEYVIFVLDELVSEKKSENKVSKEEEEDIKDRLKKLGYID
ncbi:MAG: CopG family transcriptional regulator [Candidatus ainarchaeum sp.]|nr:CopG family transcriptional regulator [Candidatus ainarchaeum sp.]